MHIYQLNLVLAEPLYFASRELGRLYITESYLHNYALTFALNLAVGAYRDHVHVPRYKEQLEPINEAGIYITPAKPVQIAYSANMFKFADIPYRLKPEKISYNIPTYGRIREIVPESKFRCYAICNQERVWPRWIRLGKWLSKVEVIPEKIEFEPHNGSFFSAHPLNPLDLPVMPKMFNLINMPPVSLVDKAFLEGKHLRLRSAGKQDICLPADMAYRFPA